MASHAAFTRINCALVKLNGCRHADTRRNRRRPGRLGQFFAVKSVCQNCKQKFTPDLPGAIAGACAIAYAVSVNAARKVAQVKERRRPRPRWRSSRRPQRMSLNAGPSCKKPPGSDRHDGAFHATWAPATGMWHGSLAQPGTTPPSSSTLNILSLRANATCSKAEAAHENAQRHRQPYHGRR
jgi:hypothetical protein